MGWAELVEEEDILGQAEEKERQRYIAYRCHQSTTQCALFWLWAPASLPGSILANMPPLWACFSVTIPKLLFSYSCQAFWVSCTFLPSHLHLICSQCPTHSASCHLFPPFQTVLRDVVSDPILLPLGLCIPLRSSTYFWFTWCRKCSSHSPLLDSVCGHQRTKGTHYSEREQPLWLWLAETVPLW